MPTYHLRIPPEDVIRLICAETDAAGQQPEFSIRARDDYVIEEDYDRTGYALPDGEGYDLVSEEAVLSIEPRLEQNDWVLSIVIRRELGPRAIGDENALLGVPLSVDAFRSRFLAPDTGKVSVRLEVRTAAGRRHFDDWWAALNARHPTGAAAEAAPQGQAASANPPPPDRWTYRNREAVGVFADPDGLDAAVAALEAAGFDRARMSVLGTAAASREHIGRWYRSVAEIEDDSAAPRTAFVAPETRVEGEAMAVAVPVLLGGLAGAAAVAASGGALALAIGVTILGGAAGAGVGGMLSHAVARHHARRVAEQLAEGGLVLWVGAPDAATESRALEVLRQAGAKDVHVHEIARQWGPDDRPLSQAWVDPFLHRDPAP